MFHAARHGQGDRRAACASARAARQVQRLPATRCSVCGETNCPSGRDETTAPGPHQVSTSIWARFAATSIRKSAAPGTRSSRRSARTSTVRRRYRITFAITSRTTLPLTSGDRWCALQRRRVLLTGVRWVDGMGSMVRLPASGILKRIKPRAIEEPSVRTEAAPRFVSVSESLQCRMIDGAWYVVTLVALPKAGNGSLSGMWYSIGPSPRSTH